MDRSESFPRSSSFLNAKQSRANLATSPSADFRIEYCPVEAQAKQVRGWCEQTDAYLVGEPGVECTGAAVTCWIA
jgi:hypothetical protein